MICRICKKDLPNSSYRHRNTFCIDCENKKSQQRREKAKHEAIMHYGGYVCVCCGETNPLFLSIDHVNMDGYKLRKENSYHRTLAMWLKTNQYPEGYQILCFNCNIGRSRNNGICPHCNQKE